ncbi:MAG TPA: glutathione S-transferase [Stellaceae bacterium]|jgi:glutathione S-transferase|nr:glutathione S-transferase [Stellaceae bacterium]
MKLYHAPLSGHAHRVRLFLSLIGAEVELVEVDLPQAQHKSPEFLAMNPFGQVPVLDDDGTVVSDSTAILVYAAKKFGRIDWLPETPVEAAQVQRWLSVASNEIYLGPNMARLINLVGNKADPETTIARAHAILKIIDAHLAGRDWMVGSGPTLADVALYSYVARAPEGNVDLAPYARIRPWLGRIEALPGFVPFIQTRIGLAA